MAAREASGGDGGLITIQPNDLIRFQNSKTATLVPTFLTTRILKLPISSRETVLQIGHSCPVFSGFVYG